jgi:hypothetical protein
MGDTMIGREALVRAVLTLFDEGFDGPKGKGTWYIDNDPGAGLFAMMESLDAAAASRPLTPGDPLSAASHVDHLRFSLNLANRAARGEDPYPSANWHDSWKLRTVDSAAWKGLQASLRKEVADLRAILASGKPFEEEVNATGFLGLLCHDAWHLGALSQGLGRVKAPEAS